MVGNRASVTIWAADPFTWNQPHAGIGVWNCDSYYWIEPSLDWIKHSEAQYGAISTTVLSQVEDWGPSKHLYVYMRLFCIPSFGMASLIKSRPDSVPQCLCDGHSMLRLGFADSAQSQARRVDACVSFNLSVYIAAELSPSRCILQSCWFMAQNRKQSDNVEWGTGSANCLLKKFGGFEIHFWMG